MDPVLPFVARGLVALLFASAVRHKLADRPRFEGIVSDYRIAPAGWSRGIALAAIAVEGTLVIAVLLPRTTSLASVVAATLLVAYAFAIALNLARGRSEIECGCGGTGETLHPWLLARNALLGVLCAVAGAPAAARPLGLGDTATITGALVALALLGAAGSRLMRLAVEGGPEPAGEPS